jgi:dipeptidyl-peptidase-4
MEKSTGYKSFFYGNFSADRKAWETYPALPRYGVQCFAMRNQIGILSESYTYASFKDRVLAGRAFARGIFDYAAAHPDEVRKLLADARKRRDRIELRTKSVAVGGERTFLGFVEETHDGKRVATKETKDYPLRYLGGVESTLTVQRPYAYLVPAAFAKTVQTLQRHGIDVEELREDIELDVQVYKVEKWVRAERPFQKHNLSEVEVTRRDEARKLSAGTVLVRTEQPLGALASYLLEPQAEDGLTAWNFFDESLADGKDFPVIRLPKTAPLNRGAVRPLPEDRTMNKSLNAEALLGSAAPSFSGSPTRVDAWLDDEEHFLQVKERKLWKVHAVTGRAEPFVDMENFARSLQTLSTLKPDQARQLASTPSYRMNPQRTAMLFTVGDDLYHAKLDGSKAVRLTKTAGAKQVASFSPDGRFVAFVRAGNLYAVDVESQVERALTGDGGEFVLNGLADWVYSEEISNRRPQAYWWSPDSKQIAFVRIDDNPVAPFTVVDHIPTRQRIESTRYPKAGDPNPMVKLGVVSVAGGEAHFAEQGNYSPGNSIIARVGWLPDSSQVYSYWQNRAQTWLDVCTMPAAGGALTRLFREKTKAWVEDLGEPIFLGNGSFLLASEETGLRHLYLFDKSGKR